MKTPQNADCEQLSLPHRISGTKFFQAGSTPVHAFAADADTERLLHMAFAKPDFFCYETGHGRGDKLPTAQPSAIR